jgi:hypothetical protein
MSVFCDCIRIYTYAILPLATWGGLQAKMVHFDL